MILNSYQKEILIKKGHVQREVSFFEEDSYKLSSGFVDPLFPFDYMSYTLVKVQDEKPIVFSDIAQAEDLSISTLV